MGPDWHPDPSGRHELRWWDGDAWTDHVADAGVTASDPLAGGDGRPVGDASTTDPGTVVGTSDWPTSAGSSGGAGGASGAVGTQQPWAAGSTSSSGGRRVGVGWVVAIAVGVGLVSGVIGFVIGLGAGSTISVLDEVTGLSDLGGSGGGGSVGLGDAVTGDVLRPGAVVEGRVASGGATAHVLSVETGRDVRIEVVAGDFDTVLELFDAGGELRSDDDDGGDGTLSLLREDLEPGTWTVLVRGFAGAGGTYELQVD